MLLYYFVEVISGKLTSMDSSSVSSDNMNIAALVCQYSAFRRTGTRTTRSWAMDKAMEYSACPSPSLLFSLNAKIAVSSADIYSESNILCGLIKAENCTFAGDVSLWIA